MRGLREVEVISRLASISRAARGGLLPIGVDDATALQLEGTYVVNIDTVSKSADLLPGMGLRRLARKVVVQTFSDVAAKGATPQHFFLSICLPSSFERAELDEVARGIEWGLEEVNAQLMGGDVDSSGELVLTGVGVGRSAGRVIPRGGARPGDVIAVTGTFGWTWLGYRIALGRIDAPDRIRERALAAVYEPRASIEQGKILGVLEGVKASADSSDGLFKTLYSIAKASGVRIVVDELPLDPELEDFVSSEGIDPVNAVFYGGEEFHLAVSVDPAELRTVRQQLRSRGYELIEIGRVEAGEGVFLKLGGEVVPLREGGWDSVAGAYRGIL